MPDDCLFHDAGEDWGDRDWPEVGVLRGAGSFGTGCRMEASFHCAGMVEVLRDRLKSLAIGSQNRGAPSLGTRLGVGRGLSLLDGDCQVSGRLAMLIRTEDGLMWLLSA